MWLYAKGSAGLLLLSVFSLEWRRGIFKGTRARLQSLPWKFYFKIFLLLLALAILILPSDLFLRSVIQKGYEQPFFKGVVALGAFFGRSTNLWPMLAALYLLAFPLKGKSWQTFIFGLLLSSVTAGLGIHILKFTFLRARPYAGLGPFSFFNFNGLVQNDRAFQSFPSGDAAVCAGAAAYLFFALRKYKLSWLILLLPVATALARVSLNRHWPSDTVFSIGISFVAAHAVRRWEKR